MSAYFPPDPKAPTPSPAPAPAPSPTPAANKQWLVWLAVLGLGGYFAWDKLGGKLPLPVVHSAAYTAGKAYPSQLGKVYAGAWRDGAKQLDAGKGPGEAIDVVAKTWDAGRTAAFNQSVTPEFAKVVPEGKADKDLTADDRAKLAKVWREFADGLEGK
jgi:hypothetical protein